MRKNQIARPNGINRCVVSLRLKAGHPDHVWARRQKQYDNGTNRQSDSTENQGIGKRGGGHRRLLRPEEKGHEVYVSMPVPQ